METDVARAGEKVRISFDGPPELRRRVRFAALQRDMTVRDFLTEVVSERLGPEPGEAGEEKRRD